MYLSKNRTSVEFDKEIELNLDKSHGSYAYDDLTGTEYLDFFSFFASNPLGYNHPAFKTEQYNEDILKYSRIKVSSGRVYLKYFDEFIGEFHDFANAGVFEKYFFIHGGALAVENALKVAFDWKREQSNCNAEDMVVIGFKEAFHGVSGYTISLSGMPAAKVQNFPKYSWPKVSPPVATNDLVATKAAEDRTFAELEESLAAHGAKNVAAIIIEPIQCTSGDNSFRPEFFRRLREFCTTNKICLIFDEIQTGFGVTGKLWCWQQFDVAPDVLVFGKKAQVCGIAVNREFGQSGAMTTPHRMNVTWDGHIVDIVRAKHLIRYLKSSDVISTISERSSKIRNILNEMSGVSNVRGSGFLVAFELADQNLRDRLYREAFNGKLLINIAKDRGIRLRPGLHTSYEEIDEFAKRMQVALLKAQNA